MVEQLAQVNDSQYAGGDIALLAMTFEDEAAETQFDNLKVMTSSPSPSGRTIEPRKMPLRGAVDRTSPDIGRSDGGPRYIPQLPSGHHRRVEQCGRFRRRQCPSLLTSRLQP